MHCIKEVWHQSVVQIIIDNAQTYKLAAAIVEPIIHIFWPCLVHTLNFDLKIICAANNTEANEATYKECN